MNLAASRKKPWRKISSPRLHSTWIRKICAGIIILELAYLMQDYIPSDFLYPLQKEEIWVEYKENEGGSDQGYEKTYGIQFRFQDGLVDFYRKEEFNDTH